jgi:hypothetical protein
MPRRGIAVAVIVIVACFIVLGLTSDFLVDWAWFSAIGYLDVFGTILGGKAVLFFAVFAASAILLWVNGSLASRFARRRGHVHPVGFAQEAGGVQTLPELLELMRQRLPWRLLIPGVAGVLAILIAAGEVSNWDLFLRFVYQVPYGESDPQFGKDIGFYLFSLPAYVVLKNWLLLTLVLSFLVAGAVYWVHGDIEFNEQRRSISPRAIAHGSALLGLFFAVKAWSYGLDRFLLLYGDNGVVVGASYTDTHIALPVLWLLIGLSVIAALACWANLRVRTYKLPVAGAVLVFGSSLVLALVFPTLFQLVFVKPNELQLEKPYIQRNIDLTQRAYNLHQISVKPFPVEQSLTFQSLQANQATIDNIRLWDWQPLMDTYGQLQEIRTYYKFHDVDVDRYHLDGAYQGVTLSARELKPALLPPNAQTWVNWHVLFTHGNGAVMSPLARKTGEGLPIFYLQDIPGRDRRRADRRTAHLLRRRDRHLRHRQGEHPGVRLPQGDGQRLRDLYGCRRGRRRRDRRRRDRSQSPLRVVFQGPEPAAHQLYLRRQSDHVPPYHSGAGADDRPFPPPRPGPLPGGQRGPALLDAGCLYDESLFPLRADTSRLGAQLHPQCGQNRHRRLQRDGNLLRGGFLGPDRRDLPAHLPGALQAIGGHAPGLAKAYSLPGGPVLHPGASVPDLPHEQRRSLL